jgi:hypothetical protein
MTAAEIILVLYWGLIGVTWVYVVIGMASAIRNSGSGAGAELVALVIVGLASVGFVWRARSSWRRMQARPIPDHGLNGWLWRQPGWLLALLFGALYYLPTVGVIALSVYQRDISPGFWLVLLITCPAVLAVGQAAGRCVTRQHQLGVPA